MTDKQTPYELLVHIDALCRGQSPGLPAQQEVAQSWSGIGFRIADQYFVAPMSEVAEVLHEPRYTLLPGVKSWVRGVANVRGRLLPVMDLCGFFGTESNSAKKLRRLLVVEHRDVFAGLTVDAVLGMQHFAVDSYSEELPDINTVFAPFVQGAFLSEQQAWLVFSPHALARDEKFLDVVA
ncbi:chemotaxis protein CheW [Denitrificimonas caeni]|uniref:Chemotaxis protein CheW n=1 Tax=Denitrificimonas caeni TaxID=521720 RepID=A0AAE9VQC7_9GAMM|nr:chemotaxis protein CheW [Denitrificimonas caeni]NLJ13388.1 chemotaxis protein CheW [Gammaproteobacteria bacterium]WBE25518.1 chemotaxis protein CheW [Denitrificimonas caeni]